MLARSALTFGEGCSQKKLRRAKNANCHGWQFQLQSPPYLSTRAKGGIVYALAWCPPEEAAEQGFVFEGATLT